MSSPEERFVEAWIAEHVHGQGYEATDDHAERLAGRLADAAGREGHDRAALEREVGDLVRRVHDALTAATEDKMMKMDERSGTRSVERPGGDAHNPGGAPSVESDYEHRGGKAGERPA